MAPLRAAPAVVIIAARVPKTAHLSAFMPPSPPCPRTIPMKRAIPLDGRQLRCGVGDLDGLRLAGIECEPNEEAVGVVDARPPERQRSAASGRAVDRRPVPCRGNR